MTKVDLNIALKSPFAKRYENYIGGEWRSPNAGRYFDNISPITGPAGLRDCALGHVRRRGGARRGARCEGCRAGAEGGLMMIVDHDITAVCTTEGFSCAATETLIMATTSYVITDADVGRVLPITDGFLTNLTMTAPPPVYEVPSSDEGKQICTAGYFVLKRKRRQSRRRLHHPRGRRRLRSMAEIERQHGRQLLHRLSWRSDRCRGAERVKLECHSFRRARRRQPGRPAAFVG